MNASINKTISTSFLHVRFQQGVVYGLIIITALIAFELFNYGTTEYALQDLLGELSFLSIKWSTILAIAFCGIDFAGIARLFTSEEKDKEKIEVWYLFCAWLLAATMNALLTWWGVSIAVFGHHSLGNPVIKQETLLRIVPIFVAILIWLIRVLIIGSFSTSGKHIFNTRSTIADNEFHNTLSRPISSFKNPVQRRNQSPAFHTASKTDSQSINNQKQPQPKHYPTSLSSSTTQKRDFRS